MDTNMNDCEMIERKLRDGCHEGNRHNCIRDVSRLAGGCFASGRIDARELEYLQALAMSLSGGGKEFTREWNRGVEYGKGQPAERADGPDESQPDTPMDWDSPLILADAGARRLANREWTAAETLPPPPKKMDGAKQFAEYLRGLFREDEHVGFVTEAMERDGKWTPANRGVAYMTAGEMLAQLAESRDIRDVIGDYNETAGVWVRFNPLDGNGVSDANVTDCRYALVECDEDSVEKQVALIKALNLPCKFVVHSGGHSAHALVHIDAGNDQKEYRKRVEFLYKTCHEHGLKADKTGNPSRLSRMPGIMRDGNPQYIIARDLGPDSWEEWVDFLEEQADDLPPFHNAAEQLLRVERGDLPLRPELIEGILRSGHKMRLTGPSKAGKSFALLELAVSLTEGVPWMGRFNCPNPGNVLYVNLELDEASCMHRLAAIYKALGLKPKHARSLHVWQLRGHATGLDKLAPVLIRRCRDMHLAAIIVDPIYKVLTGDENAAADMARFCNHFDRVAMECGCAVIDCHHHSKGAQGGKRSMDRASGSGVFARDPDALLDMIELDCAKARKQATRNDESDALWRMLMKRNPKSAKALEPDASPDEIFAELEQIGMADEAREARLAARAVWTNCTAWRIEPTLREFPSFEAADVWFQYPAHVEDRTGFLADCQPLDAEMQFPKKKESGEKKPDAATATINYLDEVFQDPTVECVASIDAALEVGKRCRKGNCTVSTLQKAVTASGKYHLYKGQIYRGAGK